MRVVFIRKKLKQINKKKKCGMQERLYGKTIAEYI